MWKNYFLVSIILLLQTFIVIVKTLYLHFVLNSCNYFDNIIITNKPYTMVLKYGWSPARNREFRIFWVVFRLLLLSVKFAQQPLSCTTDTVWNQIQCESFDHVWVEKFQCRENYAAKLYIKPHNAFPCNPLPLYC